MNRPLLCALTATVFLFPLNADASSFNTSGLFANDVTFQEAIAQRPSNGNSDRNQRRRPPRLDLDGAAETLGVTKEELIEALGLPEKPPERDSNTRPPRPDFAGAAEELGVSKQELIDALGLQGRPPRREDNQ